MKWSVPLGTHAHATPILAASAGAREAVGPKIFHSTWSSPALGQLGGRDAIIFCGGDGIVRAFEPLAKAPPAGEVAKLQSVWRYDPDSTAPKEDVQRFLSNRLQGPSNIYGMPVLLGDRLFVGGGVDIYWGKNEAWLQCVRTAGAGDITSQPDNPLYPFPERLSSVFTALGETANS